VAHRVDLDGRLDMRVLVTGSAGFIGFTLCKVLLERGDEVIGVDNLSDYYDVQLKHARLSQLQGRPGFDFHQVDIKDENRLGSLFSDGRPKRVVHLAAQAGVRYSLENPRAYIDANVVGFCNILESCRHLGVEHLVYASSSSVYGANKNLPFAVHHNVDHPISLYAATKKANELMAHTYSALFELPTTGLRFFTVYGPWGRPDMSLFLFTKNIIAGVPIDVFNHGHHRRDFTYVDDIVEGVVRVLDNPAKPNADWDPTEPDCATSAAPYRLYNIGSNSPVELLRYIEIIEEKVGKKAEMNLLPLQPGDVPDTFADVQSLVDDLDYRPNTSIEVGVSNFVDWYREYYRV